MAGFKTLRGADLQIYINGALFANATSVRWQASKGLHEIEAIDQYIPFEIAPGQCKITGSIECTRVRQDGGLQGRGVSAAEHNLMLEKYISLAVVDRSTDTVILAIESALVGDESWNTGATSLLQGSFMFKGLGWVNEADQ